MEQTELKQPSVAPSPEMEKNAYHVETNIYPALRRTFLIVCVLLTILIALFLIYQNGKSIYESGI